MTRVGSRRVIQYAAVMLLFIGVCSKVGALFVTIPEPIIGKDCPGSLNYTSGTGLKLLIKID